MEEETKEWKEKKYGRFIEKNEIIIEDLPEEELFNIAYKMEKKCSYYLEYWKAPKQESGHLHIKGIILPEDCSVELSNKYKELIIKKYVREELWKDVDWNFYNRTKENGEPHRIVTENTEHYKGYGVKSLIQIFGEPKENPFEENVFEEAKVQLRDRFITSTKDVKDWDWLIEQAVKNWKLGDRQNNAMYLAGYLRKNKGLGIESVKSIVCEVCNQCKDEEIPMRLRAVEETFKKDEKEIKGYMGLTFLDEKQEKKVNLNLYTDKDLETFVPEPVCWIIDNQIPKGEIGLLVGKRGVRKTFVALRQAISIASGKDFLGDKISEKKKVLIIDEENGKNEIAKRIKLIKNGLGIKESLDIHFLSFEGIRLDAVTSEKFKATSEIIEELKPDLIIVDCLQRVLDIEVDRDNKGISGFFTDVVRYFTKKIGCSWLFIHHMRKGNMQYKPDDQLDEIRGGSELVNYCRYVLMCGEPKRKCKDDKILITFEVLKMSNAQITEAKVFEFISKDDFITMNYLGTPEEILNTEAKIGEAIKKYIIDNELSGEFRTGNITDNADKIGFKRSSLSLGLKWLEDNGIIVKEKRGIWRLTSDEEI